MVLAFVAFVVVCSVVVEARSVRSSSHIENLKDEIDVRLRPILRLALDRLEETRPEAIEKLRNRLVELENRPQLFSLRNWWDGVWEWIKNGADADHAW